MKVTESRTGDDPCDVGRSRSVAVESKARCAKKSKKSIHSKFKTKVKPEGKLQFFVVRCETVSGCS